jgi:RNA polymerase sigma-70 factor (ECF subfamily)
MGMSDAASEEDVVQDVLLAIHGKRDTYDPSLFFLPWFYAIVRYKVIDFGRSLRRSKSESFDETKMSPEDQLGEIEFSRDRAGDQLDLNGELQKLPRKQREILTLAKLEGLSLEEISIQTGFSISDVKVNVHRAIKSLRKNLKEPDSENR